MYERINGSRKEEEISEYVFPFFSFKSINKRRVFKIWFLNTLTSYL